MTESTLLQDFIAESEEHLEAMETNLLRLETDANDREILNEIFRSAHTIKGSAEYLGVEKIAELAHKLESLLDILRRGSKPLSNEIMDALMAGRDRIGLLLKDLSEAGVEQAEIADLLQRLERLVDPASEPADKSQKPDSAHPAMAAPGPEAGPISDPSDDLQSIFNGQAQKNCTFLLQILSEMVGGNFLAENECALDLY